MLSHLILDLCDFICVMRNLNKRISDTVWYEAFGNIFLIMHRTCHIEISSVDCVVYEHCIIIRVTYGGMERSYVIRLIIFRKCHSNEDMLIRMW